MSNEIREVIELIDDADKGSWPLSGGTLEQTASFNEAKKFFHTAISLVERRIAQRK